ncbi:MAG TPA: DUF3501 family protein [Anaeromyxobacteraceae bacterium]|nr:DUF3501 family protein [Anaeromyxobacteraceae bacterium]
MKPVTREEILDLTAYEKARPTIREQLLAVKAPRRVHLGDALTFLFENRDTVRYQVQEMVRAERMVREEEIEHELETYNELLGKPGELGAALLIEIDDPAVRAVRLREWMGLPERLYVRTASGRTVRATYDPRQVGEERLSSVQYLKFDTGGEVPVAVGVDHPRLTAEVELTPEQRRALEADLRS